VVFALRASGVAGTSALSRKIFAAAAEQDLHLALAELPAAFFPGLESGVKDRETVTALRSVLMKPEHLAWIDRIWELIQKAAGESLPRQDGGI
jgi:tyrosine decarboxylase/aspartate 1-decarboxylase